MQYLDAQGFVLVGGGRDAIFKLLPVNWSAAESVLHHGKNIETEILSSFRRNWSVFMTMLFF
jgi:hypothetical protein